MRWRRSSRAWAGSRWSGAAASAGARPATDWQGASVAVAAGAASVLVVLRRRGGTPAAMLVVVLAIGASLALDLPTHAVAAVGVITPPDWHLSVPRLSMPDWIQIG